MTKRGERQKRKGEKGKKEGRGGYTSYLREECTRGHILHSTAVACPMFNSLPHFSLCKIGNITQHTSGATDHRQTYVNH